MAAWLLIIERKSGNGKNAGVNILTLFRNHDIKNDKENIHASRQKAFGRPILRTDFSWSSVIT